MSEDKLILGLDLYSDQANEETNIFNRRETWNPQDYLEEKYLEFMTPHAFGYFSRLRPMFSFEVKSLSSINNFSHVLFRDGILFLLRFFKTYPKPNKLKTKVLISKDLAFIVPEAWKKNVLLYNTVVEPTKSSVVRDELVLSVSFGETSFCKESFETLSKLVKTKSEIKKVTILPFYNVIRGEDHLSYDRAYLFQQMEVIRRALAPLEIEFIEYSQRGHLSYEKVFYHCFHPGKVYFNDSRLDHEFYGGGALPIGTVLESYDVPLSPYHGMKILPFALDQKQLKLKTILNSLSDMSFSEPIPNRDKEDFFEIFYYSKSLLKLADELGRELFLGEA